VLVSILAIVATLAAGVVDLIKAARAVLPNGTADIPT
jgi:hypothetical protein